MQERFALIIPAAGIGNRYSSSEVVNKALLEIAPGLTLLGLTIESFIRSGCVSRIVIASRKEELAAIQAVAGSCSCLADTGASGCHDDIQDFSPDLCDRILVDTVEGGDTRQESVYNGLVHLGGGFDYVLVHDVARPLCHPDLIKKLCAVVVEQRCAAILATPVVSTIKRVSAANVARIEATVSRDRLWEAQTPQGFLYHDLMRAHRFARDKSISGTDDSTLLELLGQSVVVVEGSPLNIKVTVPDDMHLARCIYQTTSSFY